MINTWFTVNKVYKQFQNGTLKRVSEPYLLDKLFHGCRRIYEELGTRIRGNFIFLEFLEQKHKIFLLMMIVEYGKCGSIL